MLPRDSEGRIQYLMNAEESIVRAISARSPVPEILNEICIALDRQIGNMVSLISRFEDRATSLSEIARNAALFGLHIFSSVGIFAESGDELGSLEMYCCTPRHPSPFELRLIERGACLAAIAIECDTGPGHSADRRIPEKGYVRRTTSNWPLWMN